MKRIQTLDLSGGKCQITLCHKKNRIITFLIPKSQEGWRLSLLFSFSQFFCRFDNFAVILFIYFLCELLAPSTSSFSSLSSGISSPFPLFSYSLTSHKFVAFLPFPQLVVFFVTIVQCNQIYAKSSFFMILVCAFSFFPFDDPLFSIIHIFRSFWSGFLQKIFITFTYLVSQDIVFSRYFYNVISP